MYKEKKRRRFKIRSKNRLQRNIKAVSKKKKDIAKFNVLQCSDLIAMNAAI